MVRNFASFSLKEKFAVRTTDLCQSDMENHLWSTENLLSRENSFKLTYSRNATRETQKKNIQKYSHSSDLCDLGKFPFKFICLRIVSIKTN